MKLSAIMAASALGLAALSSASFAQPSTSSGGSSTGGGTVDRSLISGEPSQESPQDMRHEAAAALAEARNECRKEQGRQAQQDCMRAARDDYNHMMSMARSGGSSRSR